MNCGFFDLSSHFGRRTCAQWRHLPVPADSEILAKKFDPGKLTGCQEMIGEFGLVTVDPGRADELLPALVSKEAKEAQAASRSQMSVDLRCRLLLLLKARLVCQRGCVLD